MAHAMSIYDWQLENTLHPFIFSCWTEVWVQGYHAFRSTFYLVIIMMIFLIALPFQSKLFFSSGHLLIHIYHSFLHPPMEFRFPLPCSSASKYKLHFLRTCSFKKFVVRQTGKYKQKDINLHATTDCVGIKYLANHQVKLFIQYLLSS